MLVPVIVIGIAMAVVMACGWAYQRAANNGGWTDVFWTFGTGAICTVAALVPIDGLAGATWRQLMVACLVAGWSLRLGIYIARRVAVSREDVRYSTLREHWGAAFQTKMFALLLSQAPVTALFGIAVLFAAHQPDTGFRLADVAGLAILIGSVAGEGLADEQMKRFKSDPSAHGKVCDQGLWAWSRHPNYFFEILGWFAYPVIGFDAADLWSLLAFVAPVLMFVVIRYGTGIPPLEEAMVRSKGEAYRQYQMRVSPLLPWPPAR